jgi:outer membrane biosynthesis protein TonB
MVSESTPPPSQGGGFAKYLIALLLLGGGALGVFLATRKPEEPPAAPAPPVKKAERSTALSNDTLEIPDEVVEDAGPAPVAAAPQKRRVIPAGDPWACEGDVPPADINKVRGEYQIPIRSCYERRLRVDNALQGDLLLKVKIGNDGAVVATQLHGSLRDKDVRDCVQAIAKRWRFPTPSGGNCAVFDAPYSFTPKN